jgi:hypothetical protein
MLNNLSKIVYNWLKSIEEYEALMGQDEYSNDIEIQDNARQRVEQCEIDFIEELKKVL